jgi:hypothetical protein
MFPVGADARGLVNTIRMNYVRFWPKGFIALRLVAFAYCVGHNS